MKIPRSFYKQSSFGKPFLSKKRFVSDRVLRAEEEITLAKKKIEKFGRGGFYPLFLFFIKTFTKSFIKNIIISFFIKIMRGKLGERERGLKMSETIKIRISKDLKEEMTKFEVDWSEYLSEFINANSAI
ncbi:MAG: hypothetical protein EFT35_09630 [Methanophagales archaeon ANME-1-THS]|nr:MAG: hypothetical protein EFT35_09630 [Methanophagales archaeon ANME-1-THS]